MPMLHILSTHGLLLSFDLLNFQPSRVDICSPPQILPDQSGLNTFRPVAVETRAAVAAASPPPVSSPPQQQQQPSPISQQNSFANTTKLFAAPDFQQTGNLTFSIPETAATSTPAKPSLLLQPAIPKPNFPLSNAGAAQPAKPAMTNLFGAPAPSTQFFGGLSSNANTGSSLFNLSGSKEPIKPFAAAATPAAPSVQSTIAAHKPASETNQPFLTVQPNYKPSAQPAK